MGRPPILTTSRIWAVGYVVVVIGLVSLFVSDAEQDRALTEAKASTTNCVKNALLESNDSAEERGAAAQDRDRALVGSKRALRELIRLRVIEGIGSNEQVRQAADQYLVQTQKFIDASQALERARVVYPVPDVEDLCQ